MPLLSIVMPVYGIAGYLRECLDSILDQKFTDIEIIAVEDCSPDNSGQILDEYAARDARLRVIHLERNGGQGPARNIGVQEATGDYLWFVDSDDYLAPGALRTIAAALEEASPDVLLIDYAKVEVSGRTKQSDLRRWMREPEGRDESSPIEVFSPAERPSVMQTFHTAWSRVFKREHALATGVTFRSGWYEDVSYVYPITAAASRVAILRRVCYFYRRRRTGSATVTRASDRTFEIFGHYELCWAELDRLGATDERLRVELFERMERHYRWILGGSKRLASAREREFFEKISEHYARYRPALRPARSRSDLFKEHLFRTNAWTVFAGVRLLKRVLAHMKSKARAAFRLAKRTAKAPARAAKSRVYRLYYSLMLRLPLRDDLAVYAAYWYRGVRCSPAAVYYKAREMAPHIKGVWVVKKNRVHNVPDGVDYVVEGSLRYYRTLARAKYLINNVNFPNFYRKRKGTTYLQTHHGTPLKVMGVDHYKYPIGAHGADLNKLLRRADNWDLSVSTSPFNTEIWQRSYPCAHENLEIGYPRNDRLVGITPEQTKAARDRLALRDGQKVVLYAPTLREYDNGFVSPLDVEELAEALGTEYRILMRAHYLYDGKGNDSPPIQHPRVIDVSAHEDVEMLYIAADALITDYSSMMFDYAYLDRPIVIYAPDWETYKRVRGVTFDLQATPPGVFARSFPEIVDAFLNGDVSGEASDKARHDFQARFCPHMDGRSSERAVRRLFFGETNVGGSALINS